MRLWVLNNSITSAPCTSRRACARNGANNTAAVRCGLPSAQLRRKLYARRAAAAAATAWSIHVALSLHPRRTSLKGFAAPCCRSEHLTWISK